MGTENEIPDGATLLTADQVEIIRRNDLAAILAKVKSKTPLSALDWRKIISFSEQGESSKLVVKAGSIAELCKALGISRPTFYSVRSRYPDAPKPETNGNYDVAAWRVFLRAHGIAASSLASKADEAEDERTHLELTLLRVRCQDALVELGSKLDLLMPRAETEAYIGTLLSAYKSRLLGIPQSVAKRCEGKTAIEIKELIEDEIRRALDQDIESTRQGD